MFSRCLVLAAALSVIGSTAAAQDGSEVLVERTPAGATAFLNEFLKESGSRAGVFVYFPNRWVDSDRARFQNWRVARHGESYQSTNWGVGNGSVIGVTQPQECNSQFQLTDFRYRGTTGTRVDPYDLLISAPDQVVNYDLQWSKVSLITVSNIRSDSAFSVGFVMLVFTVDGQLAQFEFRTIEDANRVKFAMEFLKAACVPRSTTGF